MNTTTDDVSATTDRQQFKLDEALQLELSVPEGVFTPTATSRLLVQAARKFLSRPGRLLDLGAGCGLVGIALQKAGLAQGALCASDVSDIAVETIKQNCIDYGFSADARCGSIFEPWANEHFDIIVDDISGVAADVASCSPWFANVPCNAGKDGTDLTTQVIRQARRHLNPGGVLLFPTLSLSDVDKIVDTAHQCFGVVTLISEADWPLPQEMYAHADLLVSCREKGWIDFTERFGLITCTTRIYAAMEPNDHD